MAELKTKENNASVKRFLEGVENETRKKDALVLLELLTTITKEKPKMWGTSIIGFGKIHYKSERSSQEGDWMIVGFSPRKQSLTLYVHSLFPEKESLLKKLGKHKMGAGCLYINKLADINLAVLKQIIKKSYAHTKKTGEFC